MTYSPVTNTYITQQKNNKTNDSTTDLSCDDVNRVYKGQIDQNTNINQQNTTSTPPPLILQFRHSTNTCAAVISDDVQTINSPLDIYKHFGLLELNDYNPIKELPNPTANTSELNARKEYVQMVANLDTDFVYEKMKENIEKRNACYDASIENINSSSGIEAIIPNADVKPTKSILKNRNAVQTETHGIVSDSGEEEGM